MPDEESYSDTRRHPPIRPLTGLLVGIALIGAVVAWLTLRPGSDNSSSPSASNSTQSTTTTDLSDSPTFDRMRSRGGLVVGVKEDLPRIGYKDPNTGKYSGFDIEIAKLIATKLGFSEDKITFRTITPTPNTTAYERREQVIARGEVDYYVGTYTITEGRKQQVGFAGPYYLAGQDLLVRAEDTSIRGKDTLKGKKVCGVTGTTPLQLVRTQGLTEEANITEEYSYRDCVVKLLAGDVDALTTDDAILRTYVWEEPYRLRLVGQPFSEEPYGIGLSKDDKVLRAAINDILQAALEDGTWQSIYDSTLGTTGPPPRKPVIDRY